jgi:hypothetical protein
MTFQKFLQEKFGKPELTPLKDLLQYLNAKEIEEAVQEYKGLDFVKQCGCCEEEAMHRVIYACNECEKHI